MAVSVFSRVGARLKFAHMDLDALRFELARRYSMQVDPRALAALAADKRIRRPDVDVLVAIAGVLAVPVDALLDVRAASMPPNGGAADGNMAREGVSPSTIPDAREGDDALLDPAREERLRALMRVRDDAERALTEAEARELDELLDAVGRALVARNIDYAALRPRQRVAAATYDHISNFAWACFFCNRHKSGTPRPRGSTRLYDPRGDTWSRHFAFSRTKGYVVIVGLTAIGRDTDKRAIIAHHRDALNGPIPIVL